MSSKSAGGRRSLIGRCVSYAVSECKYKRPTKLPLFDAKQREKALAVNKMLSS